MAGAPHIAGPPPAHTGGFGEPTCVACHLGSDLNAPGSTLEILGLAATYVPGEAHEVTVRLVSFDMGAAGFQAAFRWENGETAGDRAGSALALDGRVAVIGEESTGVEYVQHTNAGSRANGERAEWTFEWTAPDRPGVVVLHVAANSGNGDNSPLDDLVYTAVLRLLPERRILPSQSSSFGRQNPTRLARSAR
ncbi:MAG: choice-of-anchor V domain-containing protein [Gemmatimonadota bacterium]